jgi:hypothetical protein
VLTASTDGAASLQHYGFALCRADRSGSTPLPLRVA